MSFGVEPDRGYPYDCGLCSEHDQHTYIGLPKINSTWHLERPMCFAVNRPGGTHLSLDDCKAAIDRLVEFGIERPWIKCALTHKPAASLASSK